jgi:transcriptional regulator with XRE-family HTH domain
MMKAAHPEVVAATRVNPGETLRQARESNGWSLAEVALKLNLTVNSLSNLEAGAFDKLPGHTFARGYIRAYAKLLGMDQAVLVQQFDQSTGTDAQGSNVHSLGRIEEPVRLSHTILRIVSLLLLMAVVGGGFVWWQDQTSAHQGSGQPEPGARRSRRRRRHHPDSSAGRAGRPGRRARPGEGATALRCRSRYVGASTGRAPHLP